MKDFKSYSSGNQNNGGNNNRTGNQNNGNSGGANGQQNLNQTINMASMLAQAFNGKSEGQILQTIIAQAEQGKRDGTLTNADLDNFYNAVYPMVDGFKRQKLKQIIARLKSI